MPKTKPFSGKALSPALAVTDDSILNVKIKSALAEIPRSNRYFIGLSGGLDSLALLHFCVPYLRQFSSSITAIHVHHGLSQQADEWATFCVDSCQAVGLDIVVEHVQVRSAGEGLEAAARKARYQVFSHHLAEGGILLLGHHLNDQAETLLMRFLKGLGPSALRGISRQRALSGGALYRPWLHLQRTVLEEELRRKTKEWIEDESNQDRRFERNFLRHEVLPLLAARRPSVLHDLQHAADRAADYVEFVEQWCRRHQGQFLSETYSMAKAIDLAQLKRFSELEQKFILRDWFDQLGVHQPGEANFSRILTDLTAPVAVSQAEVIWKDYCVRAFDGALFCFKADNLHCEKYEYCVSLEDVRAARGKQLRIELPAGTLLIEELIAASVHRNELSENQYHYQVSCWIPEEFDVFVVRSRKAGDRIRLNADFTQTLKKLYQSHRVLPWHREAIPVLQAKAGKQQGEQVGDGSSEVLLSLAGFVAHSVKQDQMQAGYPLRISYLTRNGLPHITKS